VSLPTIHLAIKTTAFAPPQVKWSTLLSNREDFDHMIAVLAAYRDKTYPKLSFVEEESKEASSGMPLYSLYDVYLTYVAKDTSMIYAVKEVREYAGLSLKEAKDLVESVRDTKKKRLIVAGVSMTDLNDMKKVFEPLGCQLGAWLPGEVPDTQETAHKFKVGDTVVFNGKPELFASEIKKGDVAKITGLKEYTGSSPAYDVHFVAADMYQTALETHIELFKLEPAPEPATAPEPKFKFKVGDKVKVVSLSGSGNPVPIGAEGVVFKLCPQLPHNLYYKVSFKNGPWYFGDEHLELVQEDDKPEPKIKVYLSTVKDPVKLGKLLHEHTDLTGLQVIEKIKSWQAKNSGPSGSYGANKTVYLTTMTVEEYKTLDVLAESAEAGYLIWSGLSFTPED
jgi:ribosomal protein L7/L12